MKKNLGKILVGLVAVIVLAVVFLRGDQLENLVKTIEEGTPLFLVLAVCLQLCKYAAQGEAFVRCFRAIEAKIKFSEGFKLIFATFFADTIIPSFNVSGTTVVVADAEKRGISAGRSTAAALLQIVSVNAGFLIIMILGFVLLALAGGLQLGWILLGIVAIATVGIMVFFMVFAALRPQTILKISAPFVRLADKIAHRFKKGSVDARVKKTVETYSSSAKLMGNNRKAVISNLAFDTLGSCFELLCFSLVCLSFGVKLPEVMICGYVVVTLTAMVSLIPQGVGLVEAAALITFTLFGIEQATGMAVIMVYRAIVFWLPFLIGAVVVQRAGLRES